MDQHLLRFKPNQKYLIWDLETQCLNLTLNNVPWEIGYLLVEGEKVLEQHHYRIWWDNFTISKGAAQVTRFDYADYKRTSKDSKLVLDDFEKHLYNPEIISVGHNLHNFDIYIHNQWRKKLGLETDYSYLNRCIDTNSIAKLIRLDIKEVKKENWMETMFRMSNFYQKGMKTNLTAMGKHYNIPYDYESLHSGINDVILNKLVWDKMKLEINI